MRQALAAIVMMAAAYAHAVPSALAQSPASAPSIAQRLPVCLACHGAGGAAKLPGVPSLGGQPVDYLLVQLLQFREKQRVAPPMNALTAGMSDDDLQTAAEAIANLPPPNPAEATLDPATRAEGRDLVAKYHCGSCHNADLAGHGQIPRLAGQREDYIAKSLTQYKSNARAGYEPAMNEAAQEVHEADIPVLAHYIAAFKPG